MTELGLSQRGPVVDATVDHQAAPDAAAQRHIKHRVVPLSRTMPRLPERGHIRVIVNSHRRVAELAQPAAQIKPGPPLDLV